MNVLEIMKAKGTRVETAQPKTTVGEAARMLADKRIGTVVVCDFKGKVVGILSERDIVRGIAERGAAVLASPVSELMTSRVLSCAPNDDVKHVMAEMTRWHIRHMPVMIGDELRGILSIGDVVKNLLGETQLEVDVLRDYARFRPR